MYDIALKDALVLWDPVDWSNGEATDRKARVIVVRYGAADDVSYECSNGAALIEWAEADDAQRLLLMWQLWHSLVTLYGVAPMDAHDAFSVIPEYRAAIVPDLDPGRH